VIAVKPSPELKDYIAGLVERAEKIRNRQVQPNEDNMLAVTNDGRKAALDVRLVIGAAKYDAEGKVAACVDKVHELWLESAKIRGTQLVFSDLGTPSSGFNVYSDIKMRLMAKGIPMQEIAFVHDAQTDAAKALLFKHVREGRVRVLLGSTQKCGMGTNVQTRLYALHHLDAPWRPSDVEQRDGRIERRGNMCDAIHIFRYVTEGSFDAYIWQGLAAKARFIAQIMSGDRSIRRIEDAEVAALSYEEVKAIACGNPLVKEKALLDAEYRKLCMLASHHRKTVENARWNLSSIDARKRKAESDLVNIQTDDETAKEFGEFVMVDGKRYAPGEEANQAIAAATLAVRLAPPPHREEVEVFSAFGLSVTARAWHRESRKGNVEVKLDWEFGNRWIQEIKGYASGEAMYHQLASAMAERRLDANRVRAMAVDIERQKPLLQLQSEARFEQAARLREVESKLRALEIELGLVKDMDGTAGVDESAVVANNTTLSAPVNGEADEAEPVEA
jgi:hypothetical protein